MTVSPGALMEKLLVNIFIFSSGFLSLHSGRNTTRQ